ncbi:MAG TPA: hypothetical protein VFS12_02640, partial [Terriglobia bacterium]|nr:hypothetical protein [Terriglobia bacterium]
MNPQASNNPSLAYLLWAMVLLTILVSGNSANAIAQRSIPLDVLIILDQSRSMRQNDPNRIVTQAVSEF